MARPQSACIVTLILTKPAGVPDSISSVKVDMKQISDTRPRSRAGRSCIIGCEADEEAGGDEDRDRKGIAH